MTKAITLSAEQEQFVRAAEAANQKLGTHALWREERFLDPAYWVAWCENDPVLFRVQFESLLIGALCHVLAHPGEHLPPIMNVLAKGGELERRFPPFSLTGATFAQATVTIKYALARRVLHPNEDDSEAAAIDELLSAGFGALWSLPGVEEIESKEWDAREMLGDLSFKRYEQVAAAFEERFRFDLTAYEGSDQTLAKECYLLAQVALGLADAGETFGVTALMALLRFQYYLGLVNDDVDAEINLVSLALVSQLYSKIIEGRTLGFAECVALLELRAVVERMEAVRTA
jgi:hypothetical protein